MSLNWKKTKHTVVPSGMRISIETILSLLSVSHTCIFFAFLSTFLFSDVQCGENLFMSTGPFSWSDAIQSWYNEEENFEYGVGAKTQGAVIGHYTQVGAKFLYFRKNIYVS